MGTFFTPLLLEKAFVAQDARRSISNRRFVAPSFNDIRLILNTAQIMSLTTLDGPLKLVTFDGDVTLYDDGQCLIPTNPVIPQILRLMQKGLYIGIVTAAGYTDSIKYMERLHGLWMPLGIRKIDRSSKEQPHHTWWGKLLLVQILSYVPNTPYCRAKGELGAGRDAHLARNRYSTPPRYCRDRS